MMRLKYLLLALSLGLFLSVRAQQNIREEVFLHLNTSDLIVGETLYFSSFTLSEVTGRLSDLSSYLYVELVDPKGDVVHQTKIHQKNGRGSGSIFLASNLESGVYRIVAYTRWMRNFEAFSEQRLVIINPYRSYTNPELSNLMKPKVSFFPEGGHFSTGIENTVLISVSGQYNPTQSLKAKVLAKDGRKVADFFPDQYGLGVVNFTPEAGMSYQLALELESEFIFYEMPQMCLGCTVLHMGESAVDYFFEVKSNPSETGYGKLEFWNQKEMIKELTIALNAPITVSAKDFPSGMITSKFVLNGEIRNERVFWNGIMANATKKVLPTYKRKEMVQQNFRVEPGSELSVSVKKVYGNYVTESLTSNRVVPNALKHLELPISYIQENVNNLLLAHTVADMAKIIDEVRFIPEYHCGIVQGRARPNAGSSKQTISVAVTFQGSGIEVDAAHVDQEGNFFLRYDPKFAYGDGSVGILNDSQEDYEVKVFPEFINSYESIDSDQLFLDSISISYLKERSIANQIENAFYQSPFEAKSVRAFPQIEEMNTYELDEYTRFSTMRDTFIELIQEVGVSKNEKNFNLNIRTRDVEFNAKLQAQSLFLLDGMLTTSETILRMSPYLVKTITVLDRLYFIGHVMFDGVISISTHEGEGIASANLGTGIQRMKPQNASDSLQIQVNLEKKTEPVLEDMLFWRPSMKSLDSKLDLSFHTSEIPGLYETRVEGVSPDGLPISLVRRFRVR